MNIFKCYNAFVSKFIRTLVYIVYPLIILIVAFLFVFGKQDLAIVQGLFILIPAASLAVFCVVDRCVIGASYSNWGKDEELLKSSVKGEKLYTNVILVDNLLRFLFGVTVFGGIVLILALSGKYTEHYDRIIASALLATIAFHAVSTMMVNIIRNVEGITAVWLILYGLEMLYGPELITIVLGEPVIMYGLCIPYLLIDIICMLVGRNISRKLVKEKWYIDSKNVLERNRT